MSQQERDWLEWLKKARDGDVTQRRAAEKMGVTDRWVRELLKRMKRRGDGVVVHGLRGRESNRKIAAKTPSRALGILKQPGWYNFGPTFASEQLAKRHGISISDETLRRWMIKAGLWKAASYRIEQVHCWQPRRSAFGELVQWDTSEHNWLEERGPVCYLVPADRRCHQLELAQVRGARRHATEHGCAVGVHREERPDGGCVYRSRFDVHGAARWCRCGRRTETDHLTQVGRSLRELGIGWIAAYPPQAKGRIERSFLTAQDRLVKQLRLAGISTMEAANAFLENEYWPE